MSRFDIASGRPAGRFELKFPIEIGTALRFLEGSRGALERDPHAEVGGYRVSSLYFDSPDLRAYWEKLDGEARRRKFRLRFYTPIDAATDGDGHFLGRESAKMEIKYRLDNRVYKERVDLSPEGAEALLAGDVPLAELESCLRDAGPQAAAVAESILRASHAQDLEPVNIITYVREAWVGREDPRLRVTVDHRLRAYHPREHRLVASESGMLLVPEAASILEVKFDRAIPRELRDRLQSSGIRLRRFSKYAAGIEAPKSSGQRARPIPVARPELQRSIFQELEGAISEANAPAHSDARADQPVTAGGRG